MFSERICECKQCGRSYAYDPRKGHTLNICNSCRSNLPAARHTLKAALVALKGGHCGLCGYARCLQALTFHHLDPQTKRFNVAGSHTRGWDALVAEAARCVLLCANCHREVENGVAEIPPHIRRRVAVALRGVERRERRRPGRPAAA